MRFRFGVQVLDLRARELRDAHGALDLEPRTFDVLAHLVRHRDRVVTKEELLDEIWGDRFVSESALSSRIKDARKALGDDGRAQRAIRTVHRVGFRFVADVVEEADELGTRTLGASAWTGSRRRPLFGREGDLAELTARLDDHRLVTVTGPGGVGKSVLVEALLEEGLPPAGRRRWLCELAKVREGGAVASVVLGAIGEGQQGDAEPAESLVRALERQSGVLVLDNCEHVAEQAVEIIGEVTRRCPGVTVVTTSRTPLGVAGESVLVLEPLGVSDAAACFAARSADAGASVDPSDSSVRELCLRLDGLPLALELAAARARTLGAAQLCSLLDDRFGLLRDATHDDPRHRSLHATIEWSWHELAAEDQELLACLSVFVGPFTLEDAAEVAFEGADVLDVVDALERLVATSLLGTVGGPAGRTRLRLLESVREFAAGQVGDLRSVQRRHVAHFARLAERLDEACQSEHADEALEAMSIAWDNLRAAVGYAADAGELALARRIVAAVGSRAELYQTYEVLVWCESAAAEAALAAGCDDRAVAADALAVQARLLAHRGDQERAHRLARLARHHHESHATVLGLVWCAYYRGDLDEVVLLAERLGELSRGALGLERGYAEGFAAVVAVVRQVPELEVAAVSPAAAERGVLGELACLTAGFRLCAADPSRAAELLEAVVEAALRRDHRLLLGAAASTLTQLTLPGRPAPEAMATLQRTLRRYLDRGMWVLISADTVMAARLLADAGDLETACYLLGARRASGYQVGLSELLRVPLEDELVERLGDRFEQLAAQGAAWQPPQAAEAALAALDRCLAD